MIRILTLLAPGFEETEAVTVIDILRRAEIEVVTASIIPDNLVEGSHKIILATDTVLDQIKPEDFDGVFLPGGQPGTNNLKDDPRVLRIIRMLHKRGKWILAICAAPLVLKEAGILMGRKHTSYPAERKAFEPENYEESNVVRDKNIITSRGVGTALDFALSLVEHLKGKEPRNRLAHMVLWK
jgi:4-methyl-5(b-hydroxyethyl)-thiazole monophosphate biosynthesis